MSLPACEDPALSTSTKNEETPRKRTIYGLRHRCNRRPKPHDVATRYCWQHMNFSHPVHYPSVSVQTPSYTHSHIVASRSRDFGKSSSLGKATPLGTQFYLSMLLKCFRKRGQHGNPLAKTKKLLGCCRRSLLSRNQRSTAATLRLQQTLATKKQKTKKKATPQRSGLGVLKIISQGQIHAPFGCPFA